MENNTTPTLIKNRLETIKSMISGEKTAVQLLEDTIAYLDSEYALNTIKELEAIEKGKMNQAWLNVSLRIDELKAKYKI